MFLKGSFLITALCAISGCSAWAPTMVSSRATGIYYYRSGKGEELYRTPMKKAYVSAIRTMSELGLQVIEIKEADQRRSITAYDPTSKHRVTVDLEGMGEGKYIKASFKAVNYGLVPDHLYTRMIMEEFEKNVSLRQVCTGRFFLAGSAGDPMLAHGPGYCGMACGNRFPLCPAGPPGALRG